MKDNIIIFPERTDKIKSVAHMKPFGKKGGGKMHGAVVEFENGDIVSIYSPKEEVLTPFAVGVEVTYELMKTPGKDGGKDKTSFHSHTIVLEETSDQSKKYGPPLMSQLDGEYMEDFLFIDIETASLVEELEIDTPLYDSWAYKRRYEGETIEIDLQESFKDKAALYAETGRVVCITIGKIEEGKASLVSYYGRDEKTLLSTFASHLVKLNKRRKSLGENNYKICGHSIFRFDLPFIHKRMLVNGIRVPEELNVVFQKPWDLEEQFLDIAKLWDSIGMTKGSLLAISTVLGLPSPKSNLDGSKVSETFYTVEGGEKLVAEYCERDVFTVINIMNHLFNTEKISIFDSKYLAYDE